MTSIKTDKMLNDTKSKVAVGKYVWQLQPGDFVVAGNKKIEEVISVKDHATDHRISLVETKSGIWESYRYGMVID